MTIIILAELGTLVTTDDDGVDTIRRTILTTAAITSSYKCAQAYDGGEANKEEEEAETHDE